MVCDRGQGRALLITMAVIFLAALVAFYWAETRPVPAFSSLGVEASRRQFRGQGPALQSGLARRCFFDATTGTGTGASNAVLESMTPLGGLVAMFNLMMGAFRRAASGPGFTVCCCSPSFRRSSPA